MKRYVRKKVDRVVLDSIVCDSCGCECKGTHVDVLLHFSFSEKPEIVETICYGCYEKRFEKQLKHVRKAKMKEIVSQSEEKVTFGEITDDMLTEDKLSELHKNTTEEKDGS